MDSMCPFNVHLKEPPSSFNEHKINRWGAPPNANPNLHRRVRSDSPSRKSVFIKNYQSQNQGFSNYFPTPCSLSFFSRGGQDSKVQPEGGGGQDSKNFFRRFCDFSEKLFVKNEIKKCKFGYMGLNFSNVSGKRSLLKNAIKSEIQLYKNIFPAPNSPENSFCTKALDILAAWDNPYIRLTDPPPI